MLDSTAATGSAAVGPTCSTGIASGAGAGPAPTSASEMLMLSSTLRELMGERWRVSVCSFLKRSMCWSPRIECSLEPNAIGRVQ